MQAFADHGEVEGDTVSGTPTRPSEVLDDLEALGISYDDVVDVLEDEGVEKFDASWGELVETVQSAARRGQGEGLGERMTPPRSQRGPTRCGTRRDRRMPRIAGPCVLVIFGVTGDLSTKKLMPAVYDLANRGLLPPGFALVGFARREWEHQDFAKIVHARSSSTRAPRSAKRSGSSCRKASASCRARSATTSRSAAWPRRSSISTRPRGTGGNHAFYLSIPPGLFQTVVDQLRSHGLAEEHPGRWSRVVIEKPFGHDLASARELNRDRLQRLPLVLGVPHRPLPGQGDRPEHDGAAVRQSAVRAGVEQQLRRSCPDHHGRGHRHRRPGRVLRRHRHRPGRDPEPPAAAARADRHGGAHLVRGGQLRAEKQKVLAAARPPERMDLHTARGPYAGGWAGRREGRGLPRGGADPARPRRPRRTRRSGWTSRTAVGPACRSTCGPASGWLAG